MEKTRIIFFAFSKNIAASNRWKRIIYQYRRKGGNDNFNIKPNTAVSEFQFEAKYINVLFGRGKRGYNLRQYLQYFRGKEKLGHQKEDREINIC